MASILIVEDDQKLANVTSMSLRQLGHDVEVAYSLETARIHLKEFGPDIVLTDLHLGDDSGLQVLSEAKQEPSAPEVILITAHADAATAAQAMADGAHEYLTKPCNMDELANLIKRISERRELIAENRKLREQLEAKKQAVEVNDNVVVASAAMRELLDRVRKVAPLQTTVLIRGESGTGKEVVARFIHAHGKNPACPFIAINCGAIPENLLTSELFGHERGAYTGASARRAGAFERANGGILFLDEMGEISQATQVALLRVLETGEVTRVGGEKPFKVNVRLIAATHQNLEQRVSNGDFREDLYYRINVFTASIPPLRERLADIAPIGRHFLKGFGMDADAIPDEVFHPLMSYPWPGNVRELRNVMENFFISCLEHEPSPSVMESIIPKPLVTQPISQGGATGEETLEEAETRKIRQALAEANGNKTKAAESLGITRRRLYSRMNVLGIETDD